MLDAPLNTNSAVVCALIIYKTRCISFRRTKEQLKRAYLDHDKLLLDEVQDDEREKD